MPHRNKLPVVHVSEDVFWEKYEPIPRDDEQIIRDHEDTLQFQREMVWSLVEGDVPDVIYALPGYRVVNVIGYVATMQFWESEYLEAVYFDPRNH